MLFIIFIYLFIIKFCKYMQNSIIIKLFSYFLNIKQKIVH